MLRRALLEKRGALDTESARTMSAQICERIQQMPVFDAASVIYGYAPVRGEADVYPLMEEALRRGKRLALPRCLDSHGHMAFFEIHSFGDLRRGVFQIPEPREGLPRLEVTEGLMLVPGVGFDFSCGRLGYGGGYYDRFIGACHAVSYIAPAFALQLVKAVPLEAHDRKVDAVVTERQIIDNRKEYGP